MVEKAKRLADRSLSLSGRSRAECAPDEWVLARGGGGLCQLNPGVAIDHDGGSLGRTLPEWNRRFG